MLTFAGKNLFTRISIHLSEPPGMITLVPLKALCSMTHRAVEKAQSEPIARSS
jgi:hypothetical protein